MITARLALTMLRLGLRAATEPRGADGSHGRCIAVIPTVHEDLQACGN
jgi:hypothetical protein